MGRIKDLVIELQEEYGYDLENLPEVFSNTWKQRRTRLKRKNCFVKP